MIFVFDIIIMMIAASFIFFIPGYILSLLISDELEILERIAISIGLSIAMAVFLGFMLSGLGLLFSFKGINTISIWASFIIVSGILGIILFLKMKRKRNNL